MLLSREHNNWWKITVTMTQHKTIFATRNLPISSEHSRSGYLAVRYKYLFDLENRASVTGSSVSWTPWFMSEDNLLEASSGLKSLIARVSSYQAGIV